MEEINNIINSIRAHNYMSGINRDIHRQKRTGEVFTKDWLVQYGIQQANLSAVVDLADPSSTIIDTAAGDGAFLCEALIYMLEGGLSHKDSLEKIYGIEKELDNVKLLQNRLLAGNENLRYIVERNIVCHDSLTYDYSFSGSNKTIQEKLFDSLFE